MMNVGAVAKPLAFILAGIGIGYMLFARTAALAPDHQVIEAYEDSIAALNAGMQLRDSAIINLQTINIQAARKIDSLLTNWSILSQQQRDILQTDALQSLQWIDE